MTTLTPFDPDTIPTRDHGYPAVCVKIRRTWHDVIRDLRAGAPWPNVDMGEDGPRFLAWLESEMDEAPERLDVFDEWAREDGWAEAKDEARERFAGLTVPYWSRIDVRDVSGVKVYSDGRSGGWLYVVGIGKPEHWGDVCRWCGGTPEDRGDGPPCPLSDYEVDPEQARIRDAWAAFASWAEARAQYCADEGVRLIYLNLWCVDGRPRPADMSAPTWREPVYSPGHYA